jgi:hypothetical protein
MSEIIASRLSEFLLGDLAGARAARGATVLAKLYFFVFRDDSKNSK